VPKGGNRKEKAEANGKKVGRPKNPVLAMESIYKDFTKDVKEFRSNLQRGYAGGIAVMAQKFPQLVERQVSKAIDEDDGDAQRFLIERFLKVVQPESMGGDSPAAEFLRILRESFAKPVPNIIDVTVIKESREDLHEMQKESAVLDGIFRPAEVGEERPESKLQGV